MPRYFFHCEDGHLEHDDVGTELADAGAARVEAVRLAGGLLSSRSLALWEACRWRIVVTDENALILYTIEVNTLVGADLPPWHKRSERVA